MFIYKTTKVKLLRKYHDVTLTAKYAAAYTSCSRPHRKLILIAVLLKFSQTNLNVMDIQKVGKLTF